MKIFADVLEAIIGAVYIDSGCNLTETHHVFMKIFEPYLYFYGNLETVQDHPKTKLLQLWNQHPYGKISGHPININHTNAIEEYKDKDKEKNLLSHKSIFKG